MFQWDENLLPVSNILSYVILKQLSLAGVKQTWHKWGSSGMKRNKCGGTQ